MLACSGRGLELLLLVDSLFITHDGMQATRRRALESVSHAACNSGSGLCKEPPGLPPGLYYSHGTLPDRPPAHSQAYGSLLGGVTPFECAAAHGHTEAMTALIQVCRCSRRVCVCVCGGGI